MAEPIRFVDMMERDTVERGRIHARIRELEAALKDAGVVVGANGAAVSPEEVELIQLRERLDDAVVDPIFLAVSADIAPNGPILHDRGILPSQQAVQRRKVPLTPQELEIAAVFGILVRDNQSVSNRQRFLRSIPTARGEFKADRALYEQVLPQLVRVGDKRGRHTADDDDRRTDDVRAADLASVVRKLSLQKVDAEDIYLEVKVGGALDGLAAGDGRQAPSNIDIDLPNLEDESNTEIVQNNLDAMQGNLFAATLEELKFFQVADKLVELFNQGVLPLGKGRAGDLLFDYWRKSNERFTEIERLNLYARSFGFPGGEPSLAPNREFNDLWLRFLSAVASFARQLSLDNLLRAQIAASVSQEQVRKSGRDLAANLSLYGYGVAYFAATSLQEQIRDILELLGDSEIQGAYGARDAWQVIDQVATLELGGARSTVRYRTMAMSSATIVRWLRNHGAELTAVGVPVIDEAAVRRGGKSARPTVFPTDRDLVDAAEAYLAVTGTPEAQVEEYAQPVEATDATSAPNWLGGVVRDALSTAGISSNGGGIPV